MKKKLAPITIDETLEMSEIFDKCHNLFTIIFITSFANITF